MRLFGPVVCTLVLVVCSSTSGFAQVNDNRFQLQRGDNEFGFWAGGAPKATTIFGGLRDDEAEERKFFIAAFRYGRTGDRAGSNRGLNQFVISAGFSVFK